MRSLARFLLSLVLVAVGVLAGIAIARGVSGRPTTPATAPEPTPASTTPAGDVAPPSSPAPAVGEIITTPDPPAELRVGPDFTRVAGQAVKGVVNISSVSIVRAPASPFASDPFFSQFFGDDPFTRERRSSSLGSGVIVSSEGHIVTNGHVLGQGRAREVTVTLADKREVPGQVIGIDTATDIALLKVDASNLTAISWGDSSRLQIGEWVLAIGSPFSLSQTVTAGIISATGRANLGFAEYEDFIQTDAAINPGNSGGALINTSGALVGINTGIFSQSGGYQGIGFAVPSLLAQRIVKDLIAYGEVRRGFITGFAIDKLTPATARELGYSGPSTVLIVRMNTGSELYQAGVRPGDIIVSFNNTSVTDPSQLVRLVADSRIGSEATLTLFNQNRGPFDVKVPVVAQSTAPRRR